MKKFIPFLLIAWSLLIFIGYNVLSVEAKEKYDYDSYEEYTEIIEPICKEHGGKIEWGSGECMFKNDSRKKAIIFEKELDDRGLGGDYTAEEEASWHQKTEQKEMCVDNYEAKWKDGKCHFDEASKKGPVNHELEYEDDLKDSGVYEDYSERNNLKEKYLKELVNDDDNINRENADYFCDASEDYVDNKKNCDKLYDKVDKKEKEAAEQNPNAEYGIEDLVTYDNEGNKVYPETDSSDYSND
jgi:hypothetical protein